MKYSLHMQIFKQVSSWLFFALVQELHFIGVHLFLSHPNMYKILMSCVVLDKWYKISLVV